MNKSITPIIISILQIVSWAFLYYVQKYKSGQFPADFILLNLLALCNVGTLIIAYFLYFKVEDKQRIWLLPVSFAVITLLTLLIAYIIMFVYKYQ